MSEKGGGVFGGNTCKDGGRKFWKFTPAMANGQMEALGLKVSSLRDHRMRILPRLGYKSGEIDDRY